MRALGLVATVLALVFALLFAGYVLDPGEVHTIVLRGNIPAISDPDFVTGDEIGDDQLVIGYSVGDDAAAYPLHILAAHEIVHDTVGGESIVVTYCPLCRTGLVFSDRVGDRTLDFEVSGKLRHNNLLMIDLQTESLWSQIEGVAVSGPLEGERLTMLPAVIVPWGTWHSRYPDTRVLDPPLAGDRYLGLYAGFDDAPIVLTSVEHYSERMHPKTLVWGITVGDEQVAITKDAAQADPVMDLKIGGSDLVASFWGDGLRVFQAPSEMTVVDPDTMADAGGVEYHRFDASGNLSEVPVVLAYWYAWYDTYPDTDVIGEGRPHVALRSPLLSLTTLTLFLIADLVVIGLLTWDLWVHFRRAGGLYDTKWRSFGWTLFWGLAGLGMGWVFLREARFLTKDHWQWSGYLFGVAFMVLGSLLVVEAIPQWRYRSKRIRDPEATMEQALAHLHREWTKHPARLGIRYETDHGLARVVWGHVLIKAGAEGLAKAIDDVVADSQAGQSRSAIAKEDRSDGPGKKP